MTDTAPAKPRRILVVEDETIVSMDIQNSLRLLGYEVAGAATSGPEAIGKADQTMPDLVLMDIILKGEMDGVEAARTIHARLGIPVIFLTACADEKTLERAKVTEPFGYMIKPFEERELHSHIEIALYRHRMERKLRESEERYSLATQGANDGLWDWDLRSKEIYFSPRWKSMLGYRDVEIGCSPLDWFGRIHPADREQVEKNVARHLQGETGHFESEYRILDAKGAYRWVLCRGLASRDGEGRAHRIAGSQTDITDRKVYNPLTGLPNRLLFLDRVEHALRRTRDNARSFGIAVVEIGEVKTVAGSLGHVVADGLIVQAARRIQECVSAEDTVAHFGNDDFVLLIEETSDGKQAAMAASRLHKELSRAFLVDGQSIYATTHIGITVSTRDHVHPDEMIRDAYVAMQRAKGGGEGEVRDLRRENEVFGRRPPENGIRPAPGPG